MSEDDLETLNALNGDELAARLHGSPEARAALLQTAARGGVAEAQALFGQLLLDGNGVTKDERAALGWFKRAAAQHHVMAINMVGRCYDLGWGTPVDKRHAVTCYKLAAEAGLDWGMYNYATLLALGQGVVEDKPQALDWFRKAAAMGNAKAINFVGSFYEDGWVVARDMAEATACYAQAAEGGDFRGQFNYARMLIAEGETDRALAWLGRVRRSATPAFLDKAAAWLRGSSDAAVRERGVAALLGESA